MNAKYTFLQLMIAIAIVILSGWWFGRVASRIDVLEERRQMVQGLSEEYRKAK